MNADQMDRVRAMGRRIATVRNLAHLTTDEAAALAHMAPGRLAAIEAGEDDSDAVEALALSRALGVSVDFLYTCERNDRMIRNAVERARAIPA